MHDTVDAHAVIETAPDTTTATTPGTTTERARAAAGRHPVLAIGEVRWALVSTVFFALAGPAQLLGAPSWVHLPLYAVCGVAGGWGPALSGWRALREKTLDVDLLMIVAAIGAAAIGQVFDAALLIVIFATSGALEAWATARTESSVRGLLELSPETATRVDPDSGHETEVAVTDLAVGDEILVRPGQAVGADGTVLAGVSEIDQAGITGEPLPATKQAGDEVFAGTVNGTGTVRVRVGREASRSVVARIATLVEQAAATRARTQRFVETVEQRYSVVVVVATLAIMGIPLTWGEDLTTALLRAMTFMIVASPCAVVLATMPPLLAAVATAGRRGVLVKSAQVMEDLGSIAAVALDKTGTLTLGRPELVSVHPVAGADWSADAALAAAAAAEHASEHPLARAVVAGARARGLTIAPATGFTAAPGRGVSAVVAGRTVSVGRPDDLLADPCSAPPTPTTAARQQAATVDEAGRTAVLVTVDDRPVAVLAVADTVRPGAERAVAGLADRIGRGPVLLTGDTPRAATHVAAAVGIDDVRAGLLPEDKVRAVEDLRSEGRRVLFAGDGVNDAPALAAADVGVGVGMGGVGADLTLRTADVVIVRDELDTVPALLGLAHRARRTVITNLVVAAAIIVGLVVWDLVGHLPLPLGVAGHEGSTVLVGLNGLRLLRARAWRPVS